MSSDNSEVNRFAYLCEEVERAEARAERLREALNAIANGTWGNLLDQRYPGDEARITSVPEDATIRVFARLVVKDTAPQKANSTRLLKRAKS